MCSSVKFYLKNYVSDCKFAYIYVESNVLKGGASKSFFFFLRLEEYLMIFFIKPENIIHEETTWLAPETTSQAHDNALAHGPKYLAL